MKRIILFVCCVFSIVSDLLSQEIEKDLPFNYVQAEQSARERNFSPQGPRGGGSFEIPFFDDFSRYSLPTDDPNIPDEWQRWEQRQVFINASMPVAPPTIGVATFEGLDSLGCPYDFADPNSWGGADTLTSVPIDLSGLDANSNVQLMFYYEPGGIGNTPEEEDSLVLEFYSPFGAGQWFHRWAIPGTNVVNFQKVLIPITEPEYLLDGFRFRFRNYATLSASADHWHLDYVVLDQNFEYIDCDYDEVAMRDQVTTLLDEYTAMPWTHFVPEASSYMAESIDFTQSNLGPDANIVTGFNTSFETISADFPNLDFNTFNNGCSQFTRTMNLGDYTYDASVNDTCAIFDVKVFCTTTDGTPQNDTAYFKQVFQNYYAYDDGTAERAYAINTTGGKVAVKYFAEEPDTLLGIFMYWIPFVEDQSDKTFLLRAWMDEGGHPGSEIGENYIYYNPNYYCNGYNTFGYYAYDEPQYVSGNFYVGWVQDNNSELNIGNDKSGETNPTKLFYQNGGTSSWNVSEITGSVMIRPVFKSGKSAVWNSQEELNQHFFSVFPNPADDELNVIPSPGFGTYDLMIHDLSGRKISHQHFGEGNAKVSTWQFESGLYLITLLNSNGKSLQQKFAVR